MAFALAIPLVIERCVRVATWQSQWRRGLTQRDYDQLCLGSKPDRRPQRDASTPRRPTPRLYLGAGQARACFSGGRAVDAPPARHRGKLHSSLLRRHLRDRHLQIRQLPLDPSFSPQRTQSSTGTPPKLSTSKTKSVVDAEAWNMGLFCGLSCFVRSWMSFVKSRMAASFLTTIDVRSRRPRSPTRPRDRRRR